MVARRIVLVKMLPVVVVLSLLFEGVFLEAPSLSNQSPSYRTRKVGDKVEFFCKSNSFPKPTVTWLKDGVKIDTKTDSRYELVLPDHDLLIGSVTGDVAGKYRCVLENSDGSYFLGWDLVLVVPYIDDEFMYTPRNNYFYSSKREAWANCAAPAGSPRPAVTFINGSSNQPINVNDPRIEIRQLARGKILLYQMIISDATEYDTSNNWACQAKNQAGIKLSNFKIEFYGPPAVPQNIKITNRLEGFIINWDYVRNDLIHYDFRVTTTSDGKLLEYKLPESTDVNDRYHTGYEIRELKRGVEYTLQMRAVDRDNQIGKWSNPIQIKTVTLSAPYVDKVMPKKTAIGEGIRHTIKCNIRGEPLPLFEWTKNGVKIGNTDSKYVMNNDNGELTLTNPLRETSNGIYQCKGTNEHGSVKNSPTIATVEWIEEKFEFSPRNRTFYRGLDFLRISCRPPKANPDARVSWLWNNRLITPFSMPNFVISNYADPNGIFFYGLKIQRPGSVLAGNYTCVAENVGGTRLAKFTVTEIVPKKPYTIGHPDGLQELFANKTKSGWLKCQFIADPAPSIVWYHKNKPIDPVKNSHFSVSSVGVGRSTLQLVSLSSMHRGEYYCNATNIHGSTTTQASLINIIYIENEFQYWENETYVYDVAGHRTVNVTCRPPIGYPTTRMVWSNGTEDNLQYETNSDLTFITDNVDEGLYVMQVDMATKYIGNLIGCAAYNLKIGFAGKYQLRLTKLVLVGSPKIVKMDYLFDTATRLHVAWLLEKPRRDVQFTVQLEQGGNILYTAKTKKNAHTIVYEHFQEDGDEYAIVVTATDPASQETAISFSIDNKDISRRPLPVVPRLTPSSKLEIQTTTMKTTSTLIPTTPTTALEIQTTSMRTTSTPIPTAPSTSRLVEIPIASTPPIQISSSSSHQKLPTLKSFSTITRFSSSSFNTPVLITPTVQDIKSSSGVVPGAITPTAVSSSSSTLVTSSSSADSSESSTPPTPALSTSSQLELERNSNVDSSVTSVMVTSTDIEATPTISLKTSSSMSLSNVNNVTATTDSSSSAGKLEDIHVIAIVFGACVLTIITALLIVYLIRRSTRKS